MFTTIVGIVLFLIVEFSGEVSEILNQIYSKVYFSRLEVLLWFLILLALLTVLIIFVVIPGITKRWFIKRLDDTTSNFNLENLAVYLNKSALLYFKLDLPQRGTRFVRSFHVKVIGQDLEVEAIGFHQVQIHHFLERNLRNLECAVQINNLTVGVDHQRLYKTVLEIIQFPAFGVPYEDPQVIECRRQIMQDYGERIAFHISTIFPLGSSLVQYKIDSAVGLLEIQFYPVLGFDDYFGRKQMPKEYATAVKEVMNTRIPNSFDQKRFQFVGYLKEAETKVSKVRIKYDFLRGDNE